MLDKADTSRSAPIAHKLSCLDIDIAALTKVLLADESSLVEHGAGYSLFWCGKPPTDRRLSGVGFMVRNSITSKLVEVPTGHSKRIISIHLSLGRKQQPTHFSVYAPNLLADPADKHIFYSELRRLLENSFANYKVLTLGDFNAEVRRDSETWKEVL